jgi:hypothetical protein
MSNSVEYGGDWKPALVSLVASKQHPHQPYQSVTRRWLADLASKPLGESSGSVALSLGWIVEATLVSRQTNRAANYPNTKSIKQTSRQL